MRRERCPVCNAPPGTPCTTPTGVPLPDPHDAARLLDLEAVQDEVFLALADDPRIDTDWPADHD